MSLRAGTLRQRVTLQQPVVTKDAYGVQSIAWTDVATVWANVHPLSVKEFIAAGAMQSQVSARIVIRCRTDVNASWRVSYRNKFFNVAGVLPDPVSGREYLTLPVVEVRP